MGSATSTTIASAVSTVEVTVHHQTPLGQLVVSTSDAGVTCVRFADDSRTIDDTSRDTGSARAWALADQVCREFDEYFAGHRARFEVPVDLSRLGVVRRLVLEALVETVTHGQTTTYGELAKAVGMRSGARPIGGVMAGNPVLIIVPCHRVLGANGKLTGYAGGLEAKQALLDLERSDAAIAQQTLKFQVA
jgi:methylated-DNA-[protein]-cysteine S-methyltransferase